MSIRTRIAVAFAAVALPALLLVLYSTWRARNDAFLDAMYATIVDRMEAGGRDRCESDPARFGLVGRGRGRRHAHGPRPMLRGARVHAYDASFRAAAPRTPPVHAALRDALVQGDPAAFVAHDGDRVDVALRMPWDEGPCAVLVVQTRGGVLANRPRTFAREASIAFGVLLLALLVAWVALGPPIARLRALAQAVRGAPGLAYATPENVHGGDEIGAVARALEDANQRVQEHVARLETRDRALREYVDATTHDLAIPLTVLQGQLSEAEQRLREGAPLDRGLLESALAECQYLAQLVANMDIASRLEAGQPTIDRRPVDLVAVVERVAARHEPVARHAGVSLAYATPDRAVLTIGDDLLLERALGNLVHNAVRHRGASSEPGGRAHAKGHVAIVLEARVSREGQPRFSLTVVDDNPSVNDPLIEQLARGEDPNPTRQHRGRGLGLRIVRAIASAHDFTLAFKRAPEGGLEARIEGELTRA